MDAFFRSHEDVAVGRDAILSEGSPWGALHQLLTSRAHLAPGATFSMPTSGARRERPKAASPGPANSSWRLKLTTQKLYRSRGAARAAEGRLAEPREQQVAAIIGEVSIARCGEGGRWRIPE